MTNEIHLLTPAGRIKKPSYSLVCSWVKAAWEDIDTNLICRAFKCCGIAYTSQQNSKSIFKSYVITKKQLCQIKFLLIKYIIMSNYIFVLH